MLQFYCLSILMNLLAGLTIVFVGDLSGGDAFDSLDDDGFGDDSGKSAAGKSVAGKFFSADSFVHDKTFRLILGVLCAFVGFVKLLPSTSGSVAIFGDFFPALAGLCGGACLVLDYMSDMSNLPLLVQIVFIDNRRYIGFFCLASAFVHFLVPHVILF